MTVKTLKPAPGRTVRDPETKQLLAAAGETKELGTFWLRRLAAGDVVEADAVPAPVPPPDPEPVGDAPAEPADAGTPSGSAAPDAGAEPEKTNSRRARRAAQAED